MPWRLLLLLGANLAIGWALYLNTVVGAYLLGPNLLAALALLAIAWAYLKKPK